jgi:hypothetical protein
MPLPSEPSVVSNDEPANDDDSGPLKRLSFFVLLALAVEIVLLVMLGKAAL